MARMFKIKNWERFQHYKDRNPPWIKLHVEILASEDWVTLDDASKLLMLVCMMVAAKYDGHVPDNSAYIKRVSYTARQPDFKPLIQCGFLIPLADASTLQANARPEKEAETEEEKELMSDKSDLQKPKVYPAEFEKFWKGYPTDRNMSKKLAFRRWKNLNAEKRTAATAALPGFRAYCEQNRAWYRVIHAERFLSQERFEGYEAEPELTAEQIEINKDRADKLFSRGKYA